VELHTILPWTELGSADRTELFEAGVAMAMHFLAPGSCEFGNRTFLERLPCSTQQWRLLVTDARMDMPITAAVEA